GAQWNDGGGIVAGGPQRAGGPPLITPHEPRRSTEVYVSFSRHARLFKHGTRQMTGTIKILPRIVRRSRSAIADIAMAVRQGGHQAADFGGKRMMVAIAGCLEPE